MRVKIYKNTSIFVQQKLMYDMTHTKLYLLVFLLIKGHIFTRKQPLDKEKL